MVGTVVEVETVVVDSMVTDSVVDDRFPESVRLVVVEANAVAGGDVVEEIVVVVAGVVVVVTGPLMFASARFHSQTQEFSAVGSHVENCPKLS